MWQKFDVSVHCLFNSTSAPHECVGNTALFLAESKMKITGLILQCLHSIHEATASSSLAWRQEVSIGSALSRSDKIQQAPADTPGDF